MATHETSSAFTRPPYYASLSTCDGVYGGETHWAVLATDGRGIVADIEGGLTLEAKAKAEFIARACTAHDELIEALDYLLKQTVDQDLEHGIELTEGEKEARSKALAAFKNANAQAA